MKGHLKSFKVVRGHFALPRLDVIDNRIGSQLQYKTYGITNDSNEIFSIYSV